MADFISKKIEILKSNEDRQILRTNEERR